MQSSQSSRQARKIGWLNVIFLFVSPFVAFYGLWTWIKSGNFNINTIILTLIFITIIQVSITGGYHRLFSHRCYQATWPVRLFFLVFGAAAFEGSALMWSLDHRDHHNYVDDEEKDPYAITRGFFWAHFGWLLFKPVKGTRDKAKAGDLMRDPLVVWQDKYWLIVGIFAGYILPGLIALSWGDFFGGVFLAGFLRAVINHHSTFLINSLSHCVGQQTYSDTHSARDNLFTAFLTFGEGYHNYHHEFSSDYRNGPRYYDWDPTKWVIKGLSLVGLTSNLKTIPEEIIVRKRWQMREKRMMQKIAKDNVKIFDSEGKIMNALKEKAEATFQQLTKLRTEYQVLNKYIQLNGKDLVAQEIKTLKRKIAEAKDEFISYAREWNYNRLKVLAYARP
jgi:stearoyl-CoA desaturase (delta-9 desaturase)